MTSPPRFSTRPLTEEECMGLLARNRVGRLAFAFRDRVDIRPLGYVHREGWLFGRTQTGGKLETLRHHRWVAFQVEEVEDIWNWRSVVVHGPFHLLDPNAVGEEARIRERALGAVAEAFPGVFAPGGPGAERTLVFGISLQEVTGLRGRLGEEIGGES